jgi:hypothetical protein
VKKIIKWGLIGLGVLIVIAIIASAGGGDKKAKEKIEPSAEKSATKSEIKTVALNEDVRVGEVRWKVLEVKKAEAIEKEFGEPEKANGVFIIVKLEAELLGKESGTVDASQLSIIDSQKRTFKHSNEGQTALMVSKGFKESLFLKQVNPNVPISGWVAFDIAKDASGLKLKIKDLRMFSSKYEYVDLGI